MEQTKIINAFNYTNVHLKDSHWKKQFEQTKQYYLDIPNDDLLYGFRRRAGLNTPGNQLGGWYGTGIFHIFGQILSALSKMYAITKESRIKNKVYFLLEEWGKCIEPDGYGLNNIRGYVNDVCYEYEKLVGGLADAYEYTGNTEALKLLDKITSWFINSKVNRRAGEWYTLAENIYRAYVLTGSDKYRELAESFEYMEHWKGYLKEHPEFSVKHAYSHVNSLNSAAMAYVVKKDEIYLEIIKRAYQLLTERYIFPATGTYGPAEELFGKDGYLGESILGPLVRTLGCLRDAEVPCDTWAAFKLCRYLAEFTGNSDYGDWIEKLLYNGIGAEIPLEPGGKVMYYANYHVYGAYKDVKIDQFCWDNGTTMEWPCCAGTFPQAVTEYHNLIYYYDSDSLYINQYLPSQVIWQKDGIDIPIDMDTRYPEEERIEIRIGCKTPAFFTLKLRVPSWLKNPPEIELNGNMLRLEANAQSWIEIGREWNPHDKLVLKIPMHLYFSRVDRLHPHYVALHYGPVVYASPDEGVMRGDTSNPHLWIKSAGQQNQMFETMKGHVKGYEAIQKRFVPFYKIGPRERYYLYNEMDSVYKKVR